MSVRVCLCCNLQFACKCIINAMLNDLMILCNEFKRNLFAYLKTSIGFGLHSWPFAAFSVGQRFSIRSSFSSLRNLHHFMFKWFPIEFVCFVCFVVVPFAIFNAFLSRVINESAQASIKCHFNYLQPPFSSLLLLLLLNKYLCSPCLWPCAGNYIGSCCSISARFAFNYLCPRCVYQLCTNYAN